MSVSVWEAVFMLLVLKIPVLYLAGVVWYAVRAEPEPAGPADGDDAGVFAPLTPCGWSDWKRGRRRRYGRRPNAPPARTRRARVA